MGRKVQRRMGRKLWRAVRVRSGAAYEGSIAATYLVAAQRVALVELADLQSTRDRVRVGAHLIDEREEHEV